MQAQESSVQKTILRKSGSKRFAYYGPKCLPCLFRINNSKQQSDNIKGEQEMPSMKLCGNFQKK